ncbi:MAG: MaoC family dehydratase [Cupriavidus necator]
MRVFEKINDLRDCVGEVIGISDWLLIDQERVNLFADATGDHQWIHVDADRARNGPYGATIAHGFLTLSLLPAFRSTAFKVNETRAGVNYGLDKVRFPAPVMVGSLVRAHFKLLSWEPIDGGGAQMKMEMHVECQGSAKPVCIAESIARSLP